MAFEEILEAEKKQYCVEDRPVVGWLCSYTPEEIIEAAGFRPYRILPGCGPVPPVDSYVTCNICSRVKNCLGRFLTGRYDFMRGMVAAFSCNAMTHMYNIWKQYAKGIFIHNLEVPLHQGKTAVDFMEEQLAAMFDALAREAGVEADYNALQNAVLARLETTQLLNHLQNMRIMKNPPFSGAEAAKIVESASTVPRGIFNRALSKYLSVVKRSNNLEQVEVKRDKQYERAGRILITGGLIPRFLVEMVEECGGLVVVEDGCNGYRYFAGVLENIKEVNSWTGSTMAGGGPFAARTAENEQDKKRKILRFLANYYLRRLPCSRMYSATEQRCQEVVRLAVQYKVEGIIHYSLKFCDCNIYDYPFFREKAAELNIPFLHLEGEEDNTWKGQFKTRLQAFIEIVRG